MLLLCVWIVYLSFKPPTGEVLIGQTGHCPAWSTFLEHSDQAAEGAFGRGLVPVPLPVVTGYGLARERNVVVADT